MTHEPAPCVKDPVDEPEKESEAGTDEASGRPEPTDWNCSNMNDPRDSLAGVLRITVIRNLPDTPDVYPLPLDARKL